MPSNESVTGKNSTVELLFSGWHGGLGRKHKTRAERNVIGMRMVVVTTVGSSKLEAVAGSWLQ